MRTVWKFKIMDEHGVQAGRVPMPSGAAPLHVGMQDGWLCLWAEVDPSSPIADRGFAVVGTGHPVPDGARCVGSALDGPFVWHLYESKAVDL